MSLIERRFMLPLKIKVKLSYLVLLIGWSLLLSACNANTTIDINVGTTVLPTTGSLVTNQALNTTAIIISSRTETTSAQTSTTAVPTTEAVVGTIIPAIRLTQPAQSEDWQIGWLTGKTCLAPCWMGITPGKTTFEEAKILLNQFPFVKQTSKKIEGNDVYWNNNAPNSGGTIRGNPKVNPSTVLNIVPGITVPVKLGEVIKEYGEPEYIQAFSSASSPPYIYLLWLSHGIMTVNNFKDQSAIPITLGSNILLDYPIFFTPSKLEEISLWTPLPLKGFVPWKGYKDFIFYCRDYYHNFEPCKES